MINHIYQIARLITEHPDIINHNILLESLESKIKKLLTKISNKLPYEINIDEITQFSTQQRFKELEISRWIAKQVAFNPNLRVDWTLLTDYIAYLKFRDNNKYKALFKSKIQEIIKDAEEWHSQSQNNDESIIVELPNGYKIVKLTTKEHCKIEGELMDNCLKIYDPEEDDLYSLRSPDGKPKVTIHIAKDGRVNEIKGRQNKPPIKKYAELVIPWVNTLFRDPTKLFDNPKANFTSKGFNDYFGSLYDIGLLRKFAKSDNVNFRVKMSENPNAPVDILKYLSRNEDVYTRIGVAGNPNTPIDILRSLSKDEDWYIRADIANNPDTPVDILQILSKDKNKHVRAGVTNNPNTPIDVLRLLSQDKNNHVRQEAVEALRKLKDQD